MSSIFWNPSRAIRGTLVASLIILVVGCSSQEERARSYFEHGMKLLSEHNSAKAAIELRNAVKLKRDLIEAWRALVTIDEANGDWPRVVTDMRTIVELAPSDVPAKLKLGRLLLLAGSTYEALNLANAGLDLDDRNADLHALKAAVALKLNDSVGAVREARSALELDPTNADALMVMAIDRTGKGDAKAALSLFLDPIVAQAKNLENNFGFQLLKIKLLGQTGDFGGAEALLKKLIELNPQEPAYRRLLINFYVEQRRLDDAEAELRGLAAANSSDSGAALDLIRFLYTIRKVTSAARQELNTRISAGGEVFPYQLALAEMDIAEGNLAAGRQLLESMINAPGSREHVSAARIALAQMYLSNRDFDPAEKLANDTLRDDPHNVPALKIRASLRIERAQLDAAIADLLDALNRQPRSTELMSMLATAYERSGLIELADKELADATRLSNSDANIGLEYALFLQRRGSIARAEDVLNELNKRWPNNIRVLSALAQVKLLRQDWIGAQRIAESIRRVDNSGGIADQILGTALLGRNKLDEAIAAFQSACNAAPAGAQAMDLLVGALLKANRKDQAAIFLKSVLSKNPDNANALVLLGSMQLSSGSPDRALNNFLAAVKAQPKDPVGYRALADLYLSQTNYDEAIKIVRSGIQLQPNSTALHMILASVFERQADYGSAIAEYEFMLDKQPGNLILANNLASLLLDHGTDNANSRKIQSLAAILRKSDIPQFKDTLGWASYHQGDLRTAIALSEEASAALPDQAAVRYHLGMAYIAAGQFDKAAQQLNWALEMAPDHALTVKIRSALEKTGS